MVAPPAVVVREVQASDCLDFSGKTTYGDFRDDLVKDGFAIVKGAIPPAKAAAYVEQVHQYLEDFGLGYKRDDPSTVKEDCLPVINEKGMLMHYGIPHEQFVWDIRTEPGVAEAFARVYGTDDLIVSFDSINITFPRRRDIKENTAWPHQDQDPTRPGFRCLQGIVNLAPCGDNDGGLVIMKGAHLLSEEYHEAFKNEEPLWAWTNEWYGYKETGVAWLKEKGFKFEKVNCEPGDLLIWDSRTPHYNASPTGTSPRVATYVCYGPVSSATQEELQQKKEAFETYVGSSHWPQMLQPNHLPCLRKDGTPCPYQRREPRNPRKLNAKQFKYTGIPYISATA